MLSGKYNQAVFHELPILDDFDPIDCEKSDDSFWYNYEYQGDSNIICEGEKCTSQNCCKAFRDYTPIITIIIVLIVLTGTFIKSLLLPLLSIEQDT